jgi:hypothetical protein
MSCEIEMMKPSESRSKKEKRPMKTGILKNCKGLASLALAWVVALGVILPGASSQAAATHAVIPHLPGYYEGHFVRSNGDRENAKLWIQEVTQTDGAVTRYGLVLRDDGKGGAQMFRVDDLGDGKQMWMQLFQSQDGLVQFGQDATYDGTLFWQDRVAHISLAVTSFGASIGCAETVELESKDGPGWVDFPVSGKKIDGPNKSKGEIDPAHFNGRVVIDGKAYQGSYTIQRIFPGTALLHLVSVSRDAVDGHEVKKEITAVVALIFHHGWFIFGSTNQFEFVRLDPGQEICLDPVTPLED